jgi:hypothetical protein
MAIFLIMTVGSASIIVHRGILLLGSALALASISSSISLFGSAGSG